MPVKEIHIPSKADSDAIRVLAMINNGNIWEAAMYMLQNQPNTVSNILSTFAGTKTSCGVYDKDDAYQDALENLHRNLSNGYFHPVKLLVSDLHLDKAKAFGNISLELYEMLAYQEEYVNHQINNDDMEWVYSFVDALCDDLNQTYEDLHISWHINSNYAYANQALLEARTRGIAFEKCINEGQLKRSKQYESGKYKPKKDSTKQMMESINNQKMVYISALEETNETLERNIGYSMEDFSESVCDNVLFDDILLTFRNMGGWKTNVDKINKGYSIKSDQQKALFAMTLIRLGVIQKNSLPSIYADAIESFIEKL